MLAVGGKPQFLSAGCSRVLATWQLAFPRESDLRDEAASMRAKVHLYLQICICERLTDPPSTGESLCLTLPLTSWQGVGEVAEWEGFVPNAETRLSPLEGWPFPVCLFVEKSRDSREPSRPHCIVPFKKEKRKKDVLF